MKDDSLTIAKAKAWLSTEFSVRLTRGWLLAGSAAAVMLLLGALD